MIHKPKTTLIQFKILNIYKSVHSFSYASIITKINSNFRMQVGQDFALNIAFYDYNFANVSLFYKRRTIYLKNKTINVLEQYERDRRKIILHGTF